MCTAIKFNSLFGRSLDLEHSYNESAIIMPRSFNFSYLYQRSVLPHHAIMGIAHIEKGVPLFYDAINEMGLGIAGLNFPKKALYCPYNADKINIASFELIPYLLSKCDCIKNVILELKKINITNDSFSKGLPCTPLHWIIADKNEAITLELTENGMEIYKNPYGVLTNNPEFSFHISNLTNYMSLGPHPPKNNLCKDINLEIYSRGMGAIGLPGDFSSASRFVRAVFVKNHIINTANPVCDFFHIMNSVSIPLGCVITDTSKAVSTIYISCGDLESGKYYYNTYGNQNIISISFNTAKSDGNELFSKSIF